MLLIRDNFVKSLIIYFFNTKLITFLNMCETGKTTCNKKLLDKISCNQCKLVLHQLLIITLHRDLNNHISDLNITV